jgi:hypothetical protein
LCSYAAGDEKYLDQARTNSNDKSKWTVRYYVKLRVNGGITPQLHAWLMQFLKEWPFMIWDGAFAAPLGMKVEQLAPLPVTHASVKDAFQAMTRHDFQMAVRFNQQHNKE